MQGGGSAAPRASGRDQVQRSECGPLAAHRGSPQTTHGSPYPDITALRCSLHRGSCHRGVGVATGGRNVAPTPHVTGHGWGADGSWAEPRRVVLSATVARRVARRVALPAGGPRPSVDPSRMSFARPVGDRCRPGRDTRPAETLGGSVMTLCALQGSRGVIITMTGHSQDRSETSLAHPEIATPAAERFYLGLRACTVHGARRLSIRGRP
eukprot:356451-Chlamydomonas_euryale.AAC.2